MSSTPCVSFFVLVSDVLRSRFVSYILIALAWENRLQALQKLVRLIFPLAFQIMPPALFWSHIFVDASPIRWFELSLALRLARVVKSTVFYFILVYLSDQHFGCTYACTFPISYVVSCSCSFAHIALLLGQLGFLVLCVGGVGCSFSKVVLGDDLM